ncbi:Gamma-glutamylputrescine oxidoreductase [Ruegeria denitrificans]|uniref:Gamma-glutamylputrescine oxidoreductase n=1 Tax=Ruegeria denitrificans TaxID=1715692 RepID=A0A0P1IJY3_9RHOB|nr:FAD-binding oxidoreductase [Ruegeria denitrificans]CUK18275.1 Gamma-glutamylputrescine oxidoreductase [Ruegeria denitrificans]
MHANSYYAATARDTKGFAQLAENTDVDVAIIGGGFSGVATAVELAERGKKVVLLEANKVGWGATGRNGGQVTGSLSGDKAMAREFRRSVGSEADDVVWKTRWRGHDIIRNRIEKYGIECDLSFGHLQTAMKASHLDELKAIYDEALKRGMGDDLELVDGESIPNYLETDIYCGGLLNRRNMHVHSMDLCVGEARAAESLGAMVYENSQVLKIEHGSGRPVLITEHGRVVADRVLIAGNAYHHLEQKELKGKMFPASLANMATVELGEEVARQINPHNLAVYDCRFVLDYYRCTADHRLMFGGGTNYSGRDSQDIGAELRPALERTFPRLKGIDIEFSWAGIDGIVLNRIPQVGKIGENVFYMQGYSGHGIALTHILGEIMADAICGDLTEYLIYENVHHTKLPFTRTLGSQAIAVGMMYYKLKEKLR